ncbi:hypothetical protein JKF63_06834 [Porcisia hertigi]|uniref:CHASE domain-containing protein n=1 Tax=Porcisia hertigi TaxID=2761500 RepID=A0A836LJ75_9TRYP|nr:hypothetical protein JKF63_06834 [Porcisia hertigi]
MKKMFHTPTGNSAVDEENNKRHAKRYRVYLIILAVWIALLLNLLTILTPILVLQRRDSKLRHEYQNLETKMANNCTTRFRDTILGAISAVYGVEGYIMGNMKSLPDLHESAAERTAGQNFSKWYTYAKLLAFPAPHVSLLATAPGGVILQVYPQSGEDKVAGLDFLHDQNDRLMRSHGTYPKRIDVWTIINSGDLTFTGPYKDQGLWNLDVDEGSGGTERWWVEVMQPIYAANPTSTISEDTFWGFGIALLNANSLMEKNGFPKDMVDNSMEFVIYTTSTSPDKCEVILASAEFNGERDCYTPQMQSFLSEATIRDVLREQLSWRIALKSTKRVNKLTSGLRNMIICASVMSVSVLLVMSIFLISWCTQVYDGTVHAPRMPPFAMLTIGPRRGEELWDLAADQMVEVTERLSHVLAWQMVRHRAYQIQQVHPLTTSYVTRSVATAVQMAFSIIEELHNSPIDDPLRRLLGDEGSLLMSYAVHWCTDATVRVEAMGGGFRYAGPDVVYGGRMWVFAAPNLVTVSPAALPSATRMPHVKSKLFDSVFLRGVMARQDLYIVTDTANHRLKEAEILAMHQVRRVREAKLQYAADEEEEEELGNSNSSSSSSSNVHRHRLITSYQQTGYDSSVSDGDSLMEPVANTFGADVATGNSSRSDSTPRVRSKGGAPLVVAAARKADHENNEAAVCSVPTAIVVPTTTATGKAVEMTLVEPPAPLLQPVPAGGTLRVRRGQHNSGSAIAVANALEHPDVLPTNPLVVVPPSVTVTAVAHRLSGGLSGVIGTASSSTSLSSDESITLRHPNIVAAYANDNPLAHDMNATAVTSKAGTFPGNITGPSSEGVQGAAGGTLSSAITSTNSEGSFELQRNAQFMDSFSSDLLLRPAISSKSDGLLRAVFDRQAVALDVSYDSVRVLVYYFYFSYKILFRPLAAPELHNIYRRLMASFGVPHQGILEHLAARCAIRFLQRHEEKQTLLWDQQHRLQAHARSASASTSTSADSDNSPGSTH